MTQQRTKWKWVLLSMAFFVSLTHEPPTWGAGPGAEGGDDEPHRVLMYLNSGDEKIQRGALNNMKNLYQDLGPQNLAVELVVHGAGLTLLTKKGTAFADELTELKRTYGLNYAACSDTMKATREDLISKVDETVTAMVRLMERQQQGWANIMP